jgi:4a-hydroxytetrahydrobiopterin dehydratase
VTGSGTGGRKRPLATDASLAALAALHCAPGATRLTDTQLRDRLAALPGWGCEGEALVKTFRFADYFETIAFVNAVAQIAHREDHHPDLGVHYDRCVVAWSTHSARGITLNDCICAARVEQLAVRE